MIDALGALMGIDIQASERPAGSDDIPSASPSSPPPPQPAASSPPPKPSTSTAPPAEDVEMEEVDDEEAKAKKEAAELKKSAGEAYKKREFDEAIKSYEKAWEVWPKDITFLTNLGGVFKFPGLM
jgi:stress-induced-phosphoprotein 1